MQERSMGVLLRLLELRKERAAMDSRRARQNFLKAENFSQQVQAYAREYDQNWSQAVVKGDQVTHLQAQAAFTNRLQSTAAEQWHEARVLEKESQLALGKAVQEADRVQAVRQWMQRQKNQKTAQMAKREERVMEDVLQSRVGQG